MTAVPEPGGTPGQAARGWTLPGLLDEWRDTVRELDARPFPDDRAERREITVELSVLRTVIGQVENALTARQPQPAPGTSRERRALKALDELFKIDSDPCNPWNQRAMKIIARGLLDTPGPQTAPGCPDPSQHVVIRDFLTGRELPHAETDGPQPAPGDARPELPQLRWAPYQEFGIPDPAAETSEPPASAFTVGATGYRGNDIIVYWTAVPGEQPAPELAAAPELRAAMRETSRVQDVAARMLSWFGGDGTRRHASATRAQLAHAYQDSGLTVPEELRRFL